MKNIDKKIIILGSTGSVGTQTVDVALEHGVRVTAIAAGSNISLLEEQIRMLKPDVCGVADERAAGLLEISVRDTGCKIISGYDGICEMTAQTDCDIVFNSISGKNGLRPTLAAVSHGKKLALANKESMVCAGEYVNAAAAASGAEIIPVDSEHCAIHQCLKSGKRDEVKRLILTASGGPFFGYTEEQLATVTREMTMKHPTWRMGKKITVDCATLANKGLEIIEAMHLFHVREDEVEVIIHRESIIHSMVEYKDSAVIAQLGAPDMHYAVKYALTYPDRCEGSVERLDFTKLSGLSFYKPDTDVFKMLELARYAGRAGGALPCVFNAANEAACDLFLRDRIRFCDIYPITAQAVYDGVFHCASVDDVFYADAQTRRAVYDRFN